ncbi:hypothetical protein KIW84_023137 [Lathyrus oleraceus]|uniref:Uncharacterized protein n=1 Tax=Pisum sativum TaxID=3888 RepID=A0A9D5B7K5_PEA|nr:hypothetical protein KIW84_023137 [Pisum sativum]
MHTRKIYVSRDVQFFETMFPYHDLQTPSIANDISINTQILDCEFDDSSSNLSPASSIYPGISHHDDTIVPILTPQDDNSSNIPSNIPSIPVETPQQHSPTAINPAERRYPQRLRTPSVRLTDHAMPLYVILSFSSLSALPKEFIYSYSHVIRSKLRNELANVAHKPNSDGFSFSIWVENPNIMDIFLGWIYLSMLKMFPMVVLGWV